ncbi:MAG: hypothetical protein DI555_11035 [Novosphingobium pentaromativorans]|uniref:Lipoprotein n=1 Tax=Novosphingobium pentaromativorans TaxID=205844 RepID=A0A2W5NM55_9SPHN|nr:MAG: hypothetical protein DI555_11035 [Novosphingobium pentaromativorans]
MKNALVASALAIALAACSSQPAKEAEPSGAVETSSAMPEDMAATSAPATPAAEAPVNVLSLEGLGDLKVGKAVPAGSSWRERGAQASDTCRTVTSPAYPGVYAIVEKDKVRRITLGQRSEVKLVEGIGVGATEADVKKWFAGFREEPHKYEASPAKYLTAPNAVSGDPALRFEIGQDGKVKLIHVGTMPVLGYVEGCS